MTDTNNDHIFTQLNLFEQAQFKQKTSFAACDRLHDAGYNRSDINVAYNGLSKIQAICYKQSYSAERHKNPASNPETFATKIALIHSELSEALEGFRKDKMDDHLQYRKSAEVELADALIRIFDLAGALGLDLAGATMEKLVYNMHRADHKPEVREQAGGKKF